MTEEARDEAEGARREAESEKERAEAANQAPEGQVWQTAGQAQLGDKMRGEQDIPTLANNIIQQLCKYLGAQVGALYVMEGGVLGLVGSYCAG